MSDDSKRFYEVAANMTMVDVALAIDTLTSHVPELNRLRDAIACTRGTNPCVNCAMFVQQCMDVKVGDQAVAHLNAERTGHN